jgi:hypothetical protein
MQDLTAALYPTQGLSGAVMAARDGALRGAVRHGLARPMPVVVVLAGLVGLAAACLNPHPDDEPTFDGSKEPGNGGVIDVLPPAETCEDNPLLAGCGLGSGGPPQRPDGDNMGAGAGGSASTGAGGAGAAGSAGSAGNGGERDAGERDAGPVDATPEANDAG